MKRKTAKRAGIVAIALPGKRPAAAKAAKGAAAAARRDARVQALLHDETVHRRLRDGLINARVVYLGATGRGDAAAAVLDDRKGRRALRRTIDAFTEAFGSVRAAKTRQRRRAATRVLVPVVVVGAAGALASSKEVRSRVPGLGSDSGDRRHDHGRAGGDARMTRPGRQPRSPQRVHHGDPRAAASTHDRGGQPAAQAAPGSPAMRMVLGAAAVGVPAGTLHMARAAPSQSRASSGKRAAREEAAGSRGAPEDPTDLPKKSWPATLKRTFKQFSEDKLTRWAAPLTYFGVLSVFPMLLALISVLGLIGPSATQPLLSNVESLAPGPARDILTGVLNNLQSGGGGTTLAFIIGLAAAIWSASGYIAAFMDASNTVWDAPEGRPIWKKIPVRLGVTIVLLVLLTATALAVVFTGPLAQRIGDVIGVGGTALTVWGIAKWPVLVLIVSFMISLLFWAAPNVKQPGFPWITPGGVLAVLLWLAASARFALYVANFGSYNETYGSLGGVIVFLIWLWITNIVILFGAEFNAEMERARAIQRGHPEDQEPYLPLRDAPEDQSTS